MDPLLIGMGYNILSGAANKVDQWESGKKQLPYLRESLASLPELEQTVQQRLSFRTNLAESRYGRTLQDLQLGSDIKLSDIFEQGEAALSKSGFTQSGSLERIRSKAIDRTQQEYGSNLESAFETKGLDILSAQETAEDQLANIEQQRQALKQQIEQIKASKPGWLTKGVGKVSNWIGL